MCSDDSETFLIGDISSCDVDVTLSTESSETGGELLEYQLLPAAVPGQPPHWPAGTTRHTRQTLQCSPLYLWLLELVKLFFVKI